MADILLALRRTLASLGDGRVWLYLLAPALISLLGLVALSAAVLDHLVATFVEQPPMRWFAEWGAAWLAKSLAVLGGWLLILSASYLLAMLLTAVAVLPVLLRHVAARDYADLAALGKDSVMASTWNSVWAAVLFVCGWVLTWPLWIVPGLGLVLPLFWMAWLNRKTFAYDVLSAHATDDEWRSVRRTHGGPLLVLGAGAAALAHVPWLGLLAPSLAALAYVHYGLEALRHLRGDSVVTMTAGQE